MSREAFQKPAEALDQVLRTLLTVVTSVLLLCVVGWFVNYFYALVALLGMVLIITYILLGPVNLMEHCIVALGALGRRIAPYRSLTRRSPEANPRILAVLIVYFVFFMTLTLGTIQFLPVLSRQVGEMGERLGTQVLSISGNIIDWSEKHLGEGVARSLFARDIQQAERLGLVKKHSAGDKAVTAEEKEVIQETLLQTGIRQFQNAVALALPHFVSFIAGTVNGFVYFMVGLLLTFFFLIDGHRFKQEVVRFWPVRDQPTVEYLFSSFHQVMFSFIKGQVMLGALTGLYMFCIYSAFHVPFAFLLGVIFALAELLPVVGTWIGITIGLSVILLTMEPLTALYVWLCSYAYQTIKDNILQPKVVGDVMGLHPLVIIVALLICAKVAGLLGVLLALPLASAINVSLRLLLAKDAEAKARLKNVEDGAHG